MRELLSEYKQSRKGLRKMLKQLEEKEKALISIDDTSNIEEKLQLIKSDKELINSMINSTTDIIEWLEKGVNPYYQKGIDRRYNYDITKLSNMDLIPDITKQLRKERKELKKLSEYEKEILSKVLSSFTDRERECYILHVACGYSMQDTADTIGLTKSTVQNHIEKARLKVRSILSKYK